MGGKRTVIGILYNHTHTYTHKHTQNPILKGGNFNIPQFNTGKDLGRFEVEIKDA